jgi:NAD(P)-dependent dehydrogenase (short-subunit alcohol dehydrogenase family)
MNMSNPVVLVTGALTGIGRATALAFARQGSRIVVSGRKEEVGEALAKELRALGAEAEFVAADVRHESDVQKLVDATVVRFGRLDIAVTTPAPRATAARSPRRAPKPTPPPSTPTCSACCSA